MEYNNKASILFSKRFYFWLTSAPPRVPYQFSKRAQETRVSWVLINKDDDVVPTAVVAMLVGILSAHR